jgi:hypothetical protein
MKTFLAVSVALVMSALFLGCTQQVMETVAGKSAVVFARQSVEALAGGKLDDVRARFDEIADTETFENDLRKVATTYPKGQTAEVSLVKFRTKDPFNVAGGQYDYVFDSRYGDIHILTNVTVVTAGGTFKLHELTARRQSDTSIAVPQWNALHYLFIVLAFTNLGVVGTALVRWYRTRKTIAGRWRWLAAIGLGVGSASLDWSTGQLSSVTPLRLLAFSAALGRELDGPWLLEVAMPIGAVAFLLGLATRMPAAQTPPAARCGTRPSTPTSC